ANENEKNHWERSRTAIERARALLSSGEYLKARSVLESALRTDSSNSDLYVLLADAWHGLRDSDNALQALSKAIQLNCRQSSVYLARACLYKERKDFVHAIEDYTKVIQIDPESPIGYYGRATAFLGECKYARARADLEYAWKRG